MIRLNRTMGWVAAAASVLLITGCSTGAAPSSFAPSPEDQTMTHSQQSSPRESTATPEAATETPIRLTFGDTTLTARLTNNPTALDLLSQLPLTLTFRDFNAVEKIADLPRPLSTDGVPPGADPNINDIGYYSPSNNLVLYYGDVGYFTGIVRIGQFDTDIAAVEAQDGDFTVSIERAT